MDSGAKKSISIIMKEFYNHGFIGIVWMIIAICNLFNLPIILKVGVSLLLLIASILQLRVIFIKSDTMDEMAIHHERIAYARVLSEFMLVLSIAGIYLVISDPLMVDLTKVFPFLIGIVNILIFLHFWYLEKVGD